MQPEHAISTGPTSSRSSLLFEPHRSGLRRSPADAAQLLRGLTLAGTHPALTGDGGPMTPEEIVSLLLDGMRNRARPAAET